MKVVVINFSGNVGKTALRKHLVSQHLKAGFKTFEIEDLNSSDGMVDEQIGESAFRILAGELNAMDEGVDVVIDIGSSNSKGMVEHFRQLRSTRNDIDFYIIPVTPQIKQRYDACSTAKALLDIGIKHERIVFIFNVVTKIENAADDFANVFTFAQENDLQIVPECVLHSDVFELLKGDPRTVYDVAHDEVDWKALKREHKGNVERLAEIGAEQVLQDLALDTCDNLTAVWSSSPMAAFQAEQV